MDLSNLLENETLRLVVFVGEIVGLVAVTLKLFSGFVWPRISKGRMASQRHFENVIGLSLSRDSYLSACVLILLTRMMTSFFFVVVSLALLLISSVLSRPAPTGVAMPAELSLLFVALSCALFVGNVVSATNFSRAVRREIDPSSVKAPFARGFFGLEA